MQALQDTQNVPKDAPDLEVRELGRVLPPGDPHNAIQIPFKHTPGIKGA